MLDPYVYPGTNILRNVLDIQDWQMLDDAEADYVSLRLRELAENPLGGDYGVDHLTEIHNSSEILWSMPKHRVRNEKKTGR